MWVGFTVRDALVLAVVGKSGWRLHDGSVGPWELC
jgi:hypothetical protein